jgi:hypothetical protein
MRQSVGGSVFLVATGHALPKAHAEFAIVGSFVDPTTQVTTRITLELTREFVYGRFYKYGVEAWQCEAQPCEYRRQFIAKVLRERGVL